MLIVTLFVVETNMENAKLSCDSSHNEKKKKNFNVADHYRLILIFFRSHSHSQTTNTILLYLLFNIILLLKQVCKATFGLPFNTLAVTLNIKYIWVNV